MALIREKYLNSVFGQCPRILCNKQMVLPVGVSNETGYSRVKVCMYYDYRYIAPNAKRFTSLE